MKPLFLSILKHHQRPPSGDTHTPRMLHTHSLALHRHLGERPALAQDPHESQDDGGALPIRVRMMPFTQTSYLTQDAKAFYSLTQSRRVHRERLRCSRWPAGGYIQAIAMYALRSLRPLRET